MRAPISVSAIRETGAMVVAMLLLRRIVWAGLAVALGACATTTPTAHKAPTARASEAAPYDFKREGQIPPATAADSRSEVDVEEIPMTQEHIDVSEAEAPPVDSTRAPVAADSMADGFRVQVFASSDREVAENARVVATQRLRLPGYLDLEAGVYKVRVGDFVTRADADQALATVRAAAYKDAWVVPSKVVVARAQTP
jgi:SPOR domain